MTLRIITILTTVFLLAVIFWQSFVHWMRMNVDKVKADPECLHMLPLAMLTFTSLVGWPLFVILVVASFARCHVPCVILLLSSVIYGVLLFVVLTNIFNQMPMVSGLAFLFLPILASLYILLPLWLLTIGLEIYFRWRYRKKNQPIPSEP